jgi:hypothetical protein
MNDRELSDLKLERKECPKCGATWLNGQHYWSGTGKKGNELDLAGLVCNRLGDDTCINPCVGMDGGDTWKKRLGDLENNFEEKKKNMENLRDEYGNL